MVSAYMYFGFPNQTFDFVILTICECFECFSSMHCFESPEWLYLKRGRESFARGPLVKADPQGRCAGVLVYDIQMIMLKAVQVCLLWSFCLHT